MQFSEVEKVINKWMVLADKNVMKAMIATVIANRLNAAPVWVMFVAPPSHGKTELLMTLDKLDYIKVISDITPNTLLSGWKIGKDKFDYASLLPQMSRNSILILKDFGTILSKRAEMRADLFGQLREVYDGKLVRSFGTGDTKIWEGKIGIIGGVTQNIEFSQMLNTMLGERFLYYRIQSPPEDEVLKKSIQNSLFENQMRQEMRDVTHEFLKSINLEKDLKPIPEIYMVGLMQLAKMAVRARSGVVRENYATKEIIDIPDHESPARFIKQLNALGIALQIICGKFDGEEYEILIHFILDSIPLKRMKVIKYLWKNSGPQGTSQVSINIKYPTTTTRRILEDLVCHDIVKRTKTDDDREWDMWELTEISASFLTLANTEEFKFRPEKITTQINQNMDFFNPQNESMDNSKQNTLDNIFD